MIFHIPHSSRVIPADIRPTIMLDDAGLEAEPGMMTDAFVDDLFCAHARQDDHLLVFPVSRLVVDPERFADDSREDMLEAGMGAPESASRHHLLRCLRSLLAAAYGQYASLVTTSAPYI